MENIRSRLLCQKDMMASKSKTVSVSSCQVRDKRPRYDIVFGERRVIRNR